MAELHTPKVAAQKVRLARIRAALDADPTIAGARWCARKHFAGADLDRLIGRAIDADAVDPAGEAHALAVYAESIAVLAVELVKRR